MLAWKRKLNELSGLSKQGVANLELHDQLWAQIRYLHGRNQAIAFETLKGFRGEKRPEITFDINEREHNQRWALVKAKGFLLTASALAPFIRGEVAVPQAYFVSLESPNRNTARMVRFRLRMLMNLVQSEALTNHYLRGWQIALYNDLQAANYALRHHLGTVKTVNPQIQAIGLNKIAENRLLRALDELLKKQHRTRELTQQKKRTAFKRAIKRTGWTVNDVQKGASL